MDLQLQAMTISITSNVGRKEHRVVYALLSFVPYFLSLHTPLVIHQSCLAIVCLHLNLHLPSQSANFTCSILPLFTCHPPL
ncbi:predicted protein [Lichtheimia corymbifera JMRC:FSU:9682]|uniref:Uncharacterized protein n=1 Tax=Lichtheimia corymbifera JMRC:FSU:9682 TaxID=1263082 RepID=A0A068RHT7_9FUNG|nr:predicted protein [Lichtheimia corymbifera JMRC:FSU:9682]